MWTDLTVGAWSIPFISLTGVLVLAAILFWYAATLLRQSAQQRRALADVLDVIRDLQDRLSAARAQIMKEKRDEPCRHLLGVWHTGLDEDSFRDVNGAFESSAWLRAPWLQFRATLLADQPIWFQDARVVGTEDPGRCFSAEFSAAAIARQNHVPAVMTGLGLLFTFLALFGALGSLHVEGDRISGLHELLQGLSGKFVTSIVGVFGATVLVMLQRAAASRLKYAMAEVAGGLSELFPPKRPEALLTQLTAQQAELLRHLRSMDRLAPGLREERHEHDRDLWLELIDSIQHLTAVLQVDRSGDRRLAAGVGRRG